MNKIILHNGIYAALPVVVAPLLFFIFFGNKPEDYGLSEIVGYSAIIVSMLFVYLGIKQYRNEKNEGSLSFGEGMKVGLLIALFPSLSFALYNWCYVELIDPGFVESYYNYQLTEAKKELSAIDYARKQADMESQKVMFTNPLIQFIVMFLTVFIFGIATTTLSSILLSHKKASST